MIYTPMATGTIVGTIRVVKVVNPNADDGGRPFHLQFDMPDELWNKIVVIAVPKSGTALIF